MVGTTRKSVFPTIQAELTTTSLPPLPTSVAPANTSEIVSPDSTSTVSPPVQPSTLLSFPDPTSYIWQPIVSDLQRPVGLANAADGSGRLFIVEQKGILRTLQNGELLAEPFLDIRDRVGANASEQGLLGLAFHPRYRENGLFYVNYTDRQGDTIIARFSVSADSPRADPASEVRLLKIVQPYDNHNGGSLAFGPDGFLYLGLGDGGAGGDPHHNGQSLDTLLGKILRLDVDHGSPYAIPADNPFANGGGLPEIWAFGLRNPWRFSFDRLSGDMYIGDVGQGDWEEIDFLPTGTPGGVNFGWNYREGFHSFEGEPPAGLNLTEPLAEYGHDQGCSVTGGVVYRGQSLAAWQGVYLYGDFCSGRVWGLLPTADGSWQNMLLFETDAHISSFGEDEAGESYLVDYGGALYQLVRK